MDLHDRVILVTGSGRRVGRVIALRLAAAGATIAVHCRQSTGEAADTAERCRAVGGRAEVFTADLEDPAASARLVQSVAARFGRLDVLVNNASTFERMTLDEFRLEDWDRTLRVNLTAPLLLTHAARSALRAAHGRVINLCDSATARASPERLAYIVSKGALETLTRALARALAPEVNVVGVAPGVAAWPGNYDQQTRDRLTRPIPLQRAGTPEDIAATVHFLLREGDYITGTVVTVDGGRSVA
jgi:pteridine reductase